jgi:hypothetical protein
VTRRTRISHLDQDGWRAAIAAITDVPPGAQPDFAEALCSAMPDADWGALLLESRGRSMLLPYVRRGGTVQAMPFGMPCGPVPLEGDSTVFDPATIRRKLDAEEFVAYVHHSRADDYSNVRPDRVHTTHVVVLNRDQVGSGYRQRARRKLRAAQRAGVEVRMGSSADVDRLLEILSVAAEDAGRALIPEPHVIRAVASTAQAMPIFAAYEGRDVSAALFLRSPIEVFYWHGGTLPEASEHSPSYAVMDAAARAAGEQGCRFLNLGSSDGLPGVAHFKEGFGAERVSYPSIAARSRRYRRASIRHSV